MVFAGAVPIDRLFDYNGQVPASLFSQALRGVSTWRRIISLVVLVTILAVIGALLFHVLASFLLPVFLAVLLVVMFGPVHRWFDARCGGRSGSRRP